MTGLFERAVGDAWTDIHPELRERYGLVADDGREAVGRGRMARLTRNALAVPALWLGTLDGFLFPETGTDVPFRITAEAFVDDRGHEALFLRREFETDPPRTFVDTLRWNPARNCVTDLLGRSGRVVSELHLTEDDGTLLLELGAQWLRVRGRYVPVPGPLAATGWLRDWYDDDEDRFRVAARISSPLVGTVFGYRGAFENKFRDVGPDATTSSSLGGVTLPGSDP